MRTIHVDGSSVDSGPAPSARRRPPGPAASAADSRGARDRRRVRPGVGALDPHRIRPWGRVARDVGQERTRPGRWRRVNADPFRRPPAARPTGRGRTRSTAQRAVQRVQQRSLQQGDRAGAEGSTRPAGPSAASRPGVGGTGGLGAADCHTASSDWASMSEPIPGGPGWQMNGDSLVGRDHRPRRVPGRARHRPVRPRARRVVPARPRASARAH